MRFKTLHTFINAIRSRLSSFWQAAAPGQVQHFFADLTLSQRFMLAGLVILLGGMIGISAWVESQIIAGVIHRTGATTALYVDSFISPNLQELGQSDELLPEHIEALGKLLQDTPMGQQIVALRVWSTRGKLLYSTDASVIGKTYPMHTGMLRARLGEVVSKLSPLEDEENASLSAQYDQLLETYSPVWLSGSDRIIAIAEFYHLTDDLISEIDRMKRMTWLVVGLSAFIMYLLLAGFVRQASDTITRQQREVSQKVTQLTDLLSQNRELHQRVRRAAGSVALLNEGYLKRIGSELHDGPAQDLGLSLLKLDALVGEIEEPGTQTGPQTVEQLTAIEASLQNALKEIRTIATGLSLPHLAEIALEETVTRVIRSHERQTGTHVTLESGPLPAQVPLPLKITAYRLIQEALNNAFRHANGADQRVRVSAENHWLLMEISDSGPGFRVEEAEKTTGRLGLSGMRERVESLGGIFHIESQTGVGTRIFARLPIQTEENGVP